MDLIEVDGSQGEGGGQILRTAVTFSAIGGTPVRVTGIRAGREVPGLKRQHITALKVLASVFGGALEGAEPGSATMTFVPGSRRLETYSEDTGTAASITLILQAVIPAVALSGSNLRLSLTGGTDVPWSPTFDYFRSIVIRGYGAIGIEAKVSATRRGYYPKGGGAVTAEIHGCDAVLPLTMTRRIPVTSALLTSRCGMLPRAVAERQARAAADRLKGSGISVAKTEVAEEPSSSPGTSVLVESANDDSFIGADAIGAKGKRAEEVGSGAAETFLSTLESGACMDSNVADMLLPLLSLAPTPSRVRIPEATQHLLSGLRLAEQFTGCRWSEEREGKGVIVTVSPGPDYSGKRHNV